MASSGQLYSIRYTTSDGRTGLGMEVSDRAYIESTIEKLRAFHLNRGFTYAVIHTYEVVPVPGTLHFRFYPDGELREWDPTKCSELTGHLVTQGGKSCQCRDSRGVIIPLDDAAALKAIRSVIADAFWHPAREGAIAAIDRLVAAESATAQPQTLIDFIEQAWPSVFPGAPFVRSPLVSMLCQWIERYSADVDAAGKVSVSLESGKRVRRREEGIFIVDDPHDNRRAEPDSEAVAKWCRDALPSRKPNGRWRDDDILGVDGEDVARSVSREPPCDAPGCVGHVRDGSATECTSSKHVFRVVSANATVGFSSDHRCLCGAISYAEAGEFTTR